MRKLFISALLASFALAGQAQNGLIRMDSASEAWRNKYPQSLFFYHEIERLLIPEGAAFGMKGITSFSPEWTLTYDSLTHELTYREAEENIHQRTYKAWYKIKGDRFVQRKHPKNYEAPAVKTYTMAISADQAAKLRSIWAQAIDTAKEKEAERRIIMMDGTNYEYFINGKRAKSTTIGEKTKFEMFALKLKEVVRNGSASSIDSLINTDL